jgi:hypothetical protein
VTVSIIVPFRGDGAERDRNYVFVRSRLETLYPDWEVIEGTCEPPWRKGIAVNRAIEASSGDVLVIHDADVMVGAAVLPHAVQELDRAAWVVPHRMVYRLNEEATRYVIATAPLEPQPVYDCLDRVQRKGPIGGGIVVARREGVEAVAGIDERFEGWGGEDISFGRALDTIVGPHARFGNVMWHLHHEPPPKRPDDRASPESEALASRYLDATGRPAAMREIIEDPRGGYDGFEGGGVVVMRRETAQEVPIDPRFAGWGQEDHCLGFALHTLFGPCWRGTASLVHLFHPPAPRLDRKRGSGESWQLFRRYDRARRNPDHMRALLKEARESFPAHQPDVCAAGPH